VRLEGKIVFITGAGSGLGRESALLFAREGARVAVTDVLPDRAEAVAKQVLEQGGSAVAMRTDVRREAEVSASVDDIVAQWGGIDVMFANAGVRVPGPRNQGGGGHTPFDELTLEAWQEVNDVNLLGVFLTCKHAARVMKPRRQGSIIVTSSAASFAGYPGMAAYSATKGGVNGMVKALSFELGASGIRVNAICPTHGMSPNFLMPPGAPVVGKSYEEVADPWDPAVSPIPLKLDRPPSLLDNAYAALFFASDESAYISGVCLPATDGGTLSRVAMFFEQNWIEKVTPS
jgi:NAD(P)-dependent dehydrogenase (short-subunit alcohol dehydrogenase family)